MSDLDQDLAKKFVNFLDKKQYEKLQFEADFLCWAILKINIL